MVYPGDEVLLENVQCRWTRNIEDMQGLDYRTRLLRSNVFSLKGRLLRVDLIKYWKIFYKKCIIKLGDIFEHATYMSTRRHQFEFSTKHVNLDCRKRLFSERCIKNWNTLPNYIA